MAYITLKEKLKGFKRLLVLGVGNQLKGDDAAGIEFARQLKRRVGLSSEMSIIEAGVAPENFTWGVRKFHPSHILVVDAAQMGMRPGSTRIVEKGEIAGFSFSTHNLSLSFLVGYLEKEFDSEVIIVGIEPSNLEFGETISKPVMDAVELLVGTLRRVLSK
nr:hydrogenase maturation peptidase HycI [Candidatus Njordarchaeum guaymaensis]